MLFLIHTLYFSVMDMANGFWSVPLHKDSQTWLAFSFDGETYQWTRLPQGFHKSPAIYHQALRQCLEEPGCPVKESTLVQYFDVFMASFMAELLAYLGSRGLKAILAKA